MKATSQLQIILSFLSLSVRAYAEKPLVELGVYVDGYYAYDANEPRDRNRLFTTLPTRHNELAINLAYLEAKVLADRLRGRVALQTGSSVTANYSAEADKRVELLQEAYGGYRVVDKLWIDAGIFLSHIGNESFISKENWTYTRSLIADYSPYYQAGVRATFEANPQWSFQLHLVNGWQNILETNDAKSVGTQISYRPTETVSVIHNTLFGREKEMRYFQDLILKYQPTPFWESSLSLDVGHEVHTWYGTSFVNRFKIAETSHVTARVEYYVDKYGALIPTGTPSNFQVWGASLNWDQQLLPQLLWRNEIRFLHSRDAIFPSRTGNKNDTVFGVTSLALSL